MNPETGHLVTEDLLKLMPKEEKEKYIPVPKKLRGAAKKKLKGRKEAYVSLTSGGLLSRWAAKKRKARRKQAKESRRKNRRK